MEINVIDLVLNIYLFINHKQRSLMQKRLVLANILTVSDTF